MGRLDGKVVLISGVARSQGRSHAVRFAEEGADVIGFDVLGEIKGSPSAPATQADMDETVRQVEALDRRIVATKADVRDWAAVKAAVDDGVAQLGRLDVVLGNAGVFTAPSLAEDMDDDIFMDTLDINVAGVWRTAKAGIPHLKKNENGGSILITSSIAGLSGLRTLRTMWRRSTRWSASCARSPSNWRRTAFASTLSIRERSILSW